MFTMPTVGASRKSPPGGQQIHYFYDEDGHVLVEVNQSGAGIKGYAYMAGQHVVEFTTQTYFIHTDHLGSTRTVTNYLGGVTDKMDYLPYGEQIAGGTFTTHKFTGYERDAESGRRIQPESSSATQTIHSSLTYTPTSATIR
jgi:hypothetical protein